ncbi:Hypothetical protein LUCI_4949 [Lucifera butyrica]|uniref:Uncharacterized protein n=1 Tax=Lucifera butyrica TaxID=1351585 RepID=A0A498RDU6_9FIRM|nr:hypothetical protein [Lucifera butyrica]VBB09651.1 Hypothetical protein LUCI_4949 [Lucifera butyrica]
MGIVIGAIIIATALLVGVSIVVVANNNVRNYKEENHVMFSLASAGKKSRATVSKALLQETH